VDPVLNPVQRLLLAALAALALAWTPLAWAQGVSEPAVKAAFLYKFGGYLEFPTSAQWPADAPFSIAVQGADDVAAELERLAPGRSIQGRRVAVRRVHEGEVLRGVQMLFVGHGESRATEAIRAAQRAGIVTVSDADRGLELGSVINLVSAEDRIAFEVSLDAAERTGVTISSRMLSVARRVAPKG
jgi:hypothetical protein